MAIKIICTLLLLHLGVIAISQENFLIHHVKGQVIALNSSGKQNAARGMIVTEGDRLELKLQSSCMLIEKSGKSLNLSKPGIYNFEKLRSMLKVAGKENVADEFFAYVYDNFTKKKKQDRLGAAPVVLRGHPKMKAPLDSVIIVSDVITFSWAKTSSILTMQFFINDENGDKHFDTSIKQPLSYTTTLSKKGLSNGKAYTWKVDESGTTQPSQVYFNFLVAKPADRKEIRKQQQVISLSKLPSAEKKILLNDLFEYWMDRYQ